MQRWLAAGCFHDRSSLVSTHALSRSPQLVLAVTRRSCCKLPNGIVQVAAVARTNNDHLPVSGVPARSASIDGATCPCRKLDPDVMMVQSAEDRQRENGPAGLDRSRQRRVFGQSQMCAGAVVILLVRAQHIPQMPLAEHDHMIEALASDRADQSFSVTVLPRRSWCCRSVANAHRANAARKCLAVDTVAITNEVFRHRFPPAGLVDLPGDPFGGWRCCDPNPKNSSAVMSEDL